MKNEYIVAIDYSANYKPMTIDYKMLKAENLLDAMNEAEQYMDKETVYLLKIICLLYTSPSPRDAHESRMPSSA